VDLIAKRSRGTPRIANRIYKRVRDFATYNGQTSITYEEAKSALDALKIDELGLDDVDIKYLTTIIERFHGGPVGLEAIASSIGEEIMNLEDVYEPYLLMIGMINRTPRGRTATEKAYEHLKKAHQGTLL
jgi:Holliday junction DNA helicase RuvB